MLQVIITVGRTPSAKESFRNPTASVTLSQEQSPFRVILYEMMSGFSTSSEIKSLMPFHSLTTIHNGIAGQKINQILSLSNRAAKHTLRDKQSSWMTTLRIVI